MLTDRGIAIEESFTARSGNTLCKYVSAAVKSGAELVVVGGGDGTLTRVVGAFAHRSAVLGILPFGTGNSFARTLGIAPTLEQAVETIVNGKAISVDLGVVNGCYFANFATIGISALVERNTPSLLKQLTGPFAYVLAGLGPFFRCPAFETHVRWEGGRKLNLQTHQLVVVNGRYFGLTPILPDATIVDGKLTCLTAEGLSRWDLAKLFTALLRGAPDRLSNVAFFQTTDVTVKTKPRQRIDVDGTSAGWTPAHFSVARKALYVLVPNDFSGR